MRLSQRLLAGFLLVLAVLVLLVVVALDRKLRDRLRDETRSELEREARLVSGSWLDGVNSDSLAGATGGLAGHRVTLVDFEGRVIGDSEFDEPALSRLENHANRPEIRAALDSGSGWAIRPSPSTGHDEIYAAVRSVRGVVRVSMTLDSHAVIVRRVQRDVLAASLFAVAIAVVLAIFFARSVSRPILRLTDDARAIAAGDLARRPVLAAPGEVGELAAAFHRLAEQLSARVKALEADDALLRAVSDSLNEGVIAMDARQDVLHVNEGARRLLGLSDSLPLPFSADRLPRDRVLRDALAAAMSGSPTDGVETRIGEHVVSLTARPLAGGGAVLALFDVTRIRRLETVRRDFVANVSHELKTPLTVINGFAETLLDPSVSAEEREKFLQTILSNSQRLQRLVDDLLDLSRIESGHWHPRPLQVDFAAVANDVIGTYSGTAASRGVILESSIASGAESLYADPTALRQILSNLVDNAIRHTQQGSITVFATRDGDGIHVGVRDTGSGIAAEHLPRVFERFYRADAARSRQEGGTGLGLAIVKHMVEGHGGRVYAESVVGAGTTVGAVFPPESARI